MIHRSLKTLQIKRIDKLFNAIIFLAFLLITCFLNKSIFDLWNLATSYILDFLQIPYQTMNENAVFPLADVSYPSINDHNPQIMDLFFGALFTLFLWFGTKLILPGDVWLPFVYFGRFLAVLLFYSILFFIFVPASFPYSLHYYAKSFFILNYILMIIINFVHFFTFYILTRTKKYKIFLTFISQLFLFLWTPINLCIHIFIIYTFSSLYLPMLSIVFSILINVLFFISFFGWACSWIQEDKPANSPEKPLDSEFMTGKQ